MIRPTSWALPSFAPAPGRSRGRPAPRPPWPRRHECRSAGFRLVAQQLVQVLAAPLWRRRPGSASGRLACGSRPARPAPPPPPPPARPRSRMQSRFCSRSVISSIMWPTMRVMRLPPTPRSYVDVLFHPLDDPDRFDGDARTPRPPSGERRVSMPEPVLHDRRVQHHLAVPLDRDPGGVVAEAVADLDQGDAAPDPLGLRRAPADGVAGRPQASARPGGAPSLAASAGRAGAVGAFMARSSSGSMPISRAQRSRWHLDGVHRLGLTGAAHVAAGHGVRVDHVALDPPDRDLVGARAAAVAVPEQGGIRGRA